ncbi:hypothetical protein K2173_000458 [Erythroxylum novogranatense]|uniref:Uncharacterized protein n=1 Tax=Erythroxylum novogranatense TaxID=1862640 RepID=A0AAV8SWA8_9ROSI|nr:hypothetical protein K2173_000458 [Erythroxylum novogranatense]
MDKNKSRTDLLAAGRKKLQQFRQKKDTKGSVSQGKSSKKSGKPDQHESDGDVLSATKAMSLPQVPDTEPISESNSSLGLAESSVFHTTNNTVASETSDIQVVDQSSTSGSPDVSVPEIELNQNSESYSEGLGTRYDDSAYSNSNLLDTKQSVTHDIERAVSLGVSNISAGETAEQTKKQDMSADIEVSASGTAVRTLDETSITGETWREDSLPSQQDVPDTSLSHLKGDEVTNVGAMQEADGLGSEHFGRSCDIRHEGDARVTLSDCNEIAENVGVAAGERISVVGASAKLRRADREDDSYSFTEKSEVLTESGINHDEGSQADITVAEAFNQQYMPEDSFIFVSKTNEEPLLTSLPIPSEGCSVSDGECPVNIPHLIEVIKGLSEDEYRILLNSRRSIPTLDFEKSRLISSQNVVPDILERLRDELYITSCAKDIIHVELTETYDLQTQYDHRFHQFDGEICALRNSLGEARERSTYLSEELELCKSELQASVSEKEALQIQFLAAKAEVDDVSSRAYELQKTLEKSESDMLNLSKESAKHEDVIASLQMEKESLRMTLDLREKEIEKLVDEKDSSLHENEKLLKELADSKSLVATLEVEVSNLNATLSSVTDERKKLEDQNQNLATGNEDLSVALSDSKSLVENLQVETANLSGKLVFATSEREKFEEEKTHVVEENEKLSSEILVLHERLAKDQEDYMQLEAELREMRLRVEHLTEENIFFESNLDLCETKLKDIDAGHQISCPVGAQNQLESSEQQSRACDNALDEVLPLQIDGKQDCEATISILHDVVSGELIQQEGSDDSSGLVILKRHIDDANKVLLKLETAIQGMPAALSRSSEKVAAPAVSKLIQAFESKVHHEEHEAGDSASAEDQSSATDSFASTKEHTGNLKAVMKELLLDVEKVSSAFMVELNHRNTSNLAMQELKVQHEALMVHSSNLESTNIELGVIYETLKQHLLAVEEKAKEDDVRYETLKQHGTTLKAENSVLEEKVVHYESKIEELQNQVHDLQQSSEMTSILLDQLQNVQKETAEKALAAEQQWDSSISCISDAMERLGDSMGFSISTLLTGDHGSVDVVKQVVASVDLAIEMIKDMKGKVDDTCLDREKTLKLLEEVNGRNNWLLEKNEVANETLNRLYHELSKLLIDSSSSMVETGVSVQYEKLPDLVYYASYEIFLEQLHNLLAERIELQSMNNNLNLELASRIKDVEELNKRCIDLSSLKKLIEDVQIVLKLESSQAELDLVPFSHLESLVSSLICKYKEVDEEVKSSGEDFGSKEMTLTEFQESVNELNALKLQHENEIQLLKEHINKVEGALVATQSDLQEKASELEQSEQRVSSIREKLSIAVAKGKGLIVQRDNLKQSLAETSSELERCLQELQLKDARLHELEVKLKTYSEAGERVEALESELSYIRNSATTLRESFLLKDSVLQRIEEILDYLDLPEDFHARDIIEKVDWLARSATGHPFPRVDWEQKSCVGGSYQDTGFGETDWKDDVQPSSNSADDTRRKYEELQSKFFGLAEQNEMLEQSLLERNHMVQRWEVLLDRISMPSHLRSMETEDRIEWLGSAILEANHGRLSLLQSLDQLENQCNSLNVDLEESQKKICVLNAELEESRKRTSDTAMQLQEVIHERESLSERLENLMSDNSKLTSKIFQIELDCGKLQNEVTVLQDKLVEKLDSEADLQMINGKIGQLQNLICNVLQDPGTKDRVCSESSTENLERLLKKLIENYLELVHCDTVETNKFPGSNANLVEEGNNDAQDIDESDDSVMRSKTLEVEDPNLVGLKKKLDETLNELINTKEERDSYIEKQQLLICEVETLDRKRMELQELLSQEQQKSTSTREKLNVAVRKGKTLLQQRDGLKQTIEEMSTEIDQLKSDIKDKQLALAECEQRLRDLTSYCGRVEALESESFSLQNRLAQTEQMLQEKVHTLSMILKTLGGIDTGGAISDDDPVGKLEHIGNLCQHLHDAVASSEQESRKSRRAAELLLAELKEVQDRNDDLQEELEKATFDLAELAKEKEGLEAAKTEALSCSEKLSSVHAQEKKKLHSELMELKSAASQLDRSFIDIHNFLANVFSKVLEFLRDLQAGTESYLKGLETNHSILVPLFSELDAIDSSQSQVNFEPTKTSSEGKTPDHFNDHSVGEIFGFLQEFLKKINGLKLMSNKHSVALHERASILSKLMGILFGELTSQKESFESMRRDIKNIESIKKEKEAEVLVLCRKNALLYEACTSSLLEIENRKAEVLANNLISGDLGMNLELTASVDGERASSLQNYVLSEEHVKMLSQRLLTTVKEFASFRSEIVEGEKNEMKIMISNLRKELQEKDIQREKICMDLVNQIKEAESSMASNLLDLQSSKAHEIELEKQVEIMLGEQSTLEQRIRKLEAGQVISKELEERIRSLTDVLTAKDQEIEALMQALDEEEVQMEEFNNKIEGLQQVVKHKDADIENFEKSRMKILKKLSTTVSKFDELHSFSEGLVVEVERLQSQLLDRDAEISFLRQEVTRCTNDALVASQAISMRNSDEIHELLKWLDSLIFPVGIQDVNLNDSSHVNDYKDLLQKKITSILSELENVQAVAQSRDSLLQVERSKVDELTRREEVLQKTLHEKESQLNMLEEIGDSGRPSTVVSEIVEVEPVINKWAAPGPSTASKVRSIRKANNDQVAIAIDTDPEGNTRLKDDDDDKVHGFKSLTTSRIVPKFTRPLADMVDGLWVSCDRALMRQPALRLSIILYWAVFHTLLATFVF